MSSAVPSGEQLPLLADVRQGTKVLMKWAEWQKQHAYPKALRIGVFRKEDMRLVVY